MKTLTNKNWWFLTINGIIAILFGILLLFFASGLIKTLMIWFGVVLLLSGVIMLLMALYNIRKNKKVGMLLFESVTSIAIALVIILFPENSLAFFLILVGVWAIIVGVVQLITLLNIKTPVANKNLLLLTGLLTIAMGVILFFNPISFAEFLVKIIGGVSVILGIFMIYFSFVLKTLKQPEDSTAQNKVQ